MSDIKWIKISTDIFDDEKIKLIEAMPDADTLLIIWLKLLVQAGKINSAGHIYLTEGIPYTDESLATIFRRPLNTVRLALQTFVKFKMVEILDNSIFLPNWEKHQNIDGMERIRQLTRERVRKFRDTHKQLPLGNVTCNVCNDADIDKDKIRKEEEKKENVILNSDNVNEIWLKTLSTLKEQVNAGAYKAYFCQTVGLEKRNGFFVIGAPNDFTVQYLRTQTSVIERELTKNMNEVVRIMFVVLPERIKGSP
jgi:predicted phage replisome organizer